MDAREIRELKQRRRGARSTGGWHRVLFLMMVAVALAGIADAQKPPGAAPAVATAAR